MSIQVAIGPTPTEISDFVDRASISISANLQNRRTASFKCNVTGFGIAVDPFTDLFSYVSDAPFVDGMAIRPLSSDTLPSGLTAGTTYYVVNSDLLNGTFQLSATVGGSPIDITDVGIGDLSVAWTLPKAGDPVYVYITGIAFFGGTVDERSAHLLGTGRLQDPTVQCVSWEQRLFKRFVGTKLTPRVYGGHFDWDAATSSFVAPSHALTNGQLVQVRTTDTLPAGLAVDTDYTVAVVDSDHFTLGAGSDAGQGAHSFHWYAGDIVEDILANVLAGEIANTTPDVQAGAVMGVIICNHTKAAELIDQCAQASNYAWWITPDQDFRFVPRTAYPADIVIDDLGENVLLNSLSVRETRENLRNVQYKKISWAAFGPTVETLTTDGVAQRWILAARAEAVESIKLNDEVLQPGIWGAEFDKPFYYSPGERTIRQNPFDPPVTAADILEVSYRPLSANVVDDFDAASIAARAAQEGGSGRYEHYLEDEEATDAVGEQERCADLVALYKNVAQIATFQTDYSWLRPGQLIPMNRTYPEMTGDWLISSVSAESRSLLGADFRFTVEALDGSQFDSWIEFWEAMAGQGGGSDARAAGGKAGDGQSETASFWVGLCAAITDGNDLTNWVPVGKNKGGTAYLCEVRAKTAPDTQDCILDIEVSTDSGGTWNSIFPAGDVNKLIIPLGEKVARATSFDSVFGRLAGKSSLRINVIQSGGVTASVSVKLWWKVVGDGAVGVMDFSEGSESSPQGMEVALI